MVSGLYKRIEKNVGIKDLRKENGKKSILRVEGRLTHAVNDGLKWYSHNVIAVQCSECQCGEKFKTSAGERQEKP